MKKTMAFLLKFTVLLYFICISFLIAYYLSCMEEGAGTGHTVPVVVIMKDSLTSEPSFRNKSPEEGLKEALAYYGIKHPEIVYAQALHETGHFKSGLCTRNNNLFGLYDSANKRYFSFSHWSESVKAYRDKVQYKYDENRHPTYYAFLSDIKYASDRKYNSRIKSLVDR